MKPNKCPVITRGLLSEKKRKEVGRSEEKVKGCKSLGAVLVHVPLLSNLKSFPFCTYMLQLVLMMLMGGLIYFFLSRRCG